MECLKFVVVLLAVFHGKSENFLWLNHNFNLSLDLLVLHSNTFTIFKLKPIIISLQLLRCLWILSACSGSLSRPRDDEFRAVVEDLRRIVERKMKDMEGKPPPPGPSGTISPPGPFMPKKMLLSFIDNYYGGFPAGNYSCKY